MTRDRPLASRSALAGACAAEARLTAVLESVFDGIVTADADGRVIGLNAGAEAMFGRPSGETLGRPVEALVLPPAGRSGVGMERYFAAGGRQAADRRVETDAVRPDGAVFPVEIVVSADGPAERRRFAIHLRDLSKRRAAERALRESEARYRAVVDHQTELICRFGPDMRLTFSNLAHARLFGATPEEIIGIDFFDHVDPSVRNAVRAAIGALTPGDPVSVREDPKTLADGSVRWFSWTNRALFDDEGRLAAYQSVGRDVTEERRAQEALRRSDDRFLGAAESLPDGMMILDPDDRIAFYNQRHYELIPEALRSGLRLGVRFGDWIREAVARGPVYHPDMGADYAERRLAARQGEPAEREHKHADGRWVRIREARMPDGGRVLLTLDVTRRRKAREALRRSEARYRAVVEGQTEFILRLRPEGVLTFVNDAYCRYRGLTRETLLAEFDDVARYPVAEQAKIRAAWATMTPERPTVAHALELPAEDGVRHEEWVDTGIFDAEGRLTEIQSVGRDVTERRRVEAEIARQREIAHQSEKMASLGSLLAGVAHELNNPLSVVVGRAIMLEDGAKEPETRAALSRLRAAAERCARIVRTFLALARQHPREPARPVDVGKVLDGVLDFAYGLRSAGIEVERIEAPGLPPAMADADQLAQVFLNLVINAQQALEATSPPRRLWLRAEAGPGVVRVAVEDNGPGVPPDLRDRVLEPFFTTKPVGAGTGLGLSLCRGVILSYGGTLSLDDRPGGGSRVVVSLPAAAPASGLAEPEAATSPQRRGADILVVDDEPEVLEMLREALAMDGHRVSTAPDGRAALEMLGERRFDAILCDLRMPRLDGPGLARALGARHPELADRLLLMTGDALRSVAALPAALRDRLIEKPLDPHEVRRRVSEVVNAGSGPRGREPAGR